jgi:alkanesulfonate monooxygenase SsuD/methylene tetrahydromethanopterin reductase-like flavin-dependent oxidoreductase (luciferase family)
VKIGLTLPQFSADAGAMVAAAQRAESAGIDAVFCYDHYPKPSRPEAQHGLTMLGALSQATERVEIGSLVARIGVVPDGVLLSALHTAARHAGPERFICGLGVGDQESDEEHEALDMARPPLEERFVRLESVACQLRDWGLTVWLAGRSRHAATLSAAIGAARNLWDPTDQQLADAVLEAEGRAITWGAQVDVTTDAGVDELAKKFAALRDMGITYAVAAPTKAGAPDAAERVMSAKERAGLS